MICPMTLHDKVVKTCWNQRELGNQWKRSSLRTYHRAHTLVASCPGQGYHFWLNVRTESDKCWRRAGTNPRRMALFWALHCSTCMSVTVIESYRIPSQRFWLWPLPGILRFGLNWLKLFSTCLWRCRATWWCSRWRGHYHQQGCSIRLCGFGMFGDWRLVVAPDL